MKVPYPEMLIAPMRGEMTAMGAKELKTVADVDDAVKNTVKPDVLATVFAGGDVEATDRARSYFTGYAPSSPSIGILRDGKLVYMMERRDIETRSAEMIAAELT